jgi:thiamine-phosphate pyrophosphorylase
MHTLAGLYVVTPNWDDTDRLIKVTEQALLGGASLVQYRHKFATPGVRLQQARRLLELCRSHQTPLIINDHWDLCMELGADGIHVGGTDMTVAKVRAIVGSDKIVGASCYGDLNLARAAQRAGASYIALGGFYPSAVKEYPVTTSFDTVRSASVEISLPNVVIGGMTIQNAKPLVERGAHMVAAISSIYLAPYPRTAAENFVRLFAPLAPG